MATTAQSPNDLTRQQLDELDDLLQRMLSLPLNPPESFAPTAPASAFAPPMPTPAQQPVPVAREVSMPAPRAYAPPAPEPPALVEAPPAWKPAPLPAPRPAVAPIPTPVPGTIIERPVPAAAPARPLPPAPETLPYAAPQPEPVPFLFAPFVAFNAILNWTLGLFGFPGRVLRSGFVKSLFGLGGLGLLIYTGLKVAQIHGLVTLPQELPWPR
jgi:hypothetical protein